MFYLFINPNIINNLNVLYLLFKNIKQFKYSFPFLYLPDLILYASGITDSLMFGVTEMKVVYLHNVYWIQCCDC